MNTSTPTSAYVKRLPRRDLREEAFRRYESAIAEGCVHSFTLDPKQYSKYGKMTPLTFICRFHDAILGYRRFNYPSTLIPKDFDVTKLHAVEIFGGLVEIINDNTEKERVEFTNKTVAANSDSLDITLCQLKDRNIKPPVIVTFTNDDEKLHAAQRIQATNLDDFSVHDTYIEVRG